MLFTPGGTDADLKVRLASPSGSITPAGHETVHVKAGMTTGVDLGEVTRGEAGSLVLTPTGGSVPVVAAVRVVRGEGGEQESAFIPAADPVGARATSADNRAKRTTLSLAAIGEAAKVKVTASAGTEGGTTATKTYTIKGGTTQTVEAPVPAGLEGAYALTVETVSGGRCTRPAPRPERTTTWRPSPSRPSPTTGERSRCRTRTRTCRYCRSRPYGHAAVAPSAVGAWRSRGWGEAPRDAGPCAPSHPAPAPGSG